MISPLVILLDSMQVIKGNVAYFLSGLMRFVGAATLVITVFQITQGDRESVKKFLTWSVVLAASIALLDKIGGEPINQWAICRGLNHVFIAMSKILQLCMGLGALVSLGVLVFRLFKGDKETAGHVLFWIVGYSGGLILLKVITDTSFM